MNVREVTAQIARLGALPYFPADDDARIGIAEVFSDCASDIVQVAWTVRRCLQLWDKWEGPHELRAVFCTKYIAADGIDAFSRLSHFADGIPSELESRNQELLYGAGEQKRLEPGAACLLIREARTLEPAERPRDAVDDISDRMDRERSVKRTPAPDEDEIGRIKAEQDRRRQGEKAAFDLAQKLRGVA